MSYTEINDVEGLNFGGLPGDRILEKLEETDPTLVEEVRGTDELYDIRDDYDGYVRSEIIDWTPEAPFLESDHPVRDPSVSRSTLNLRYNGTRGSHPELPLHPELFYGFTGSDPRGSSTDPRFDEYRGAMTARAADLTVRMGNNDDFGLAERPWTNQSISYGMKEVQRRIKQNTKIFSIEREGRPWGNNVVADEFAAGDVRAAAMGNGLESLAEAGLERFAAGDHGPASDRTGDGVRRVDRGGSAEVAPWRHTTGDADLGVHRHGQNRGAGQVIVGPGAVGGGRARTGHADQDWAESRRARSANRQALGATLALAARHRRAVKSGHHEQEAGTSFETAGPPASGLAPARDVARLYRHATEDQTRRSTTEVQDGEHASPARGLTPAAHPENAARATVAHATPNDYLANVGSIVAGLREGTAAGRRKIAGSVIADGARIAAPGESYGGARRGSVPIGDAASVASLTHIPLARAAAAEGLQVHAYGQAVPGRPEQRAALARRGYDPATWRPSHEALPIGMSKTPGEWRSATQGQVSLGDVPENVFGYAAEVSGAHGAAPTGPKRLRAGEWSDGAGLSDEVGSHEF